MTGTAECVPARLGVGASPGSVFPDARHDQETNASKEILYPLYLQLCSIQAAPASTAPIRTEARESCSEWWTCSWLPTALVFSTCRAQPKVFPKRSIESRAPSAHVSFECCPWLRIQETTQNSAQLMASEVARRVVERPDAQVLPHAQMRLPSMQDIGVALVEQMRWAVPAHLVRKNAAERLGRVLAVALQRGWPAAGEH